MSTQLIEEIKQSVADMRRHNDQRFAELKDGMPSAETIAAMNRADARITELMDKLEEERKARAQEQARLDDIEARVNRRGGGAPKVSDQRVQAYANWLSVAENREVEAGDLSDADFEKIRGYSKAFRDYVRRGEKGASPESLRILNELSVGSDPDGGFLVSPDMSGRVATLVYETSPIRSLASVQVISTDALEGDTDLDEAGANWVGETESRGETDTPEVGTWRIPVHEQAAEPRATQKILDDARIDVEAWLANKVATKFARSENAAFVTGNGIHRPRGFMTYASGTPSATTWDVIEQTTLGDASSIVDASADKFIDLAFSLKSVYVGGAVWGMRRSTEALVRKIADGQGNYLWQPDFGERGRGSLLGAPVVEMPDVAAVAANALAVVFGNFAEAYQIVDRAGISILRDPYTTKGRVKFYTTKRTGGGVINFEALKIGKIAA